MFVEKYLIVMNFMPWQKPATDRLVKLSRRIPSHNNIL